MPNSLIQQIRSSDPLWSAFVDLCDFDARLPIDESDLWFQPADARRLLPVGADASGGRYVVIEHPSPTENSAIFVSSEGQAGSVAPDVPTMLALLVAMPYWRDCVKFSAGGDLAEMRRAAAHFESQLLVEVPDADSQRHLLRSRLHLSALADPVEILHAAIPSSPAIVSRAEREPCESLVGPFRLARGADRTGLRGAP